jgi:BASS family bile acid:Na+ symporter
MTLGFFAGYIPRFDLKRKKTLAIEIGMQNAGLGVVLALKHFDETVAVPAAFYTIWCIISASIFVRLMNTSFEKKLT